MSEEALQFFPIKIQLRRHIYGQQLYDVEGRLIVDDRGRALNVYSSTLKQLFCDKKIKIIRDIVCGYRYFVTSSHQQQRFQDDRENGSLYFRKTYHVYHDDDADFEPLIKQGITILSPAY